MQQSKFVLFQHNHNPVFNLTICIPQCEEETGDLSFMWWHQTSSSVNTNIKNYHFELMTQVTMTLTKVTTVTSFGCCKCDKGCTNLDWEREADREQHCSHWTFSVMPSKKHYWPLCCVSSCSKDNTTQQTDESKDPKSVMNETPCILYLLPDSHFYSSNQI